MVLPEGTEPAQRDGPHPPKLAGIGAAIVLVLGALLVVGQLTTPSGETVAGDTTTTTTEDPLFAPTTTTTIDLDTFSASDITQGKRFSWIKSPGIGSLWPVDLVYHNQRLFLFGSEEKSQREEAGLGLVAWVSDDGISWSRLGVSSTTDGSTTRAELTEVISRDHAVFRVLTTGKTLVALTANVETGVPVVWTSADGSNWEPSELPVEPGSPGTSRFALNDAVALDGGLFVVGVMFTDSLDQVRRALPEELVGDYRDSAQLAFELTAAGGLVEVYGPLGLHGFSVWLEDLGLDDSTEIELFGAQPPRRQFVWSTFDGVNWTAAEVNSSAAERLWARPDGVLVAHGPGQRQSAIALSKDGLNWETQSRSSRAWIYQIGAITEWGDVLVGGGLGEDLFVTENGLDWEFAGTGELLPDAVNWTLQPAAGGPAGLAVVANALAANTAPTFTYTPVIIEKGDSTLTLDLQETTLRLDHPDVGVMVVPLWQTRTFDTVTVDFVNEQIIFNHPETEEPLVSFDFGTIERAADSAITNESNVQRALLFTKDGVEWSVQSLTEEIGASSAVVRMVVLDDRVVMITFPPPPESGSEAPNITIRVGLIR